jgi:hypothetical protein
MDPLLFSIYSKNKSYKKSKDIKFLFTEYTSLLITKFFTQPAMIKLLYSGNNPKKKIFNFHLFSKSKHNHRLVHFLLIVKIK